MRSINFKLNPKFKILLMACSLSFLGCEGAPQKPQVMMCFIDYPKNQAICGLTSPSLGQPMEFATETKRIPLSELDKATAFSPQDWEKLMNYKDDLEAWAKTHCGAKQVNIKEEIINGRLSR